MSTTRALLLALLTTAALVSGCGSPAPAAPAPAATTTATAPPPGEVAVSGDVHAPRTWSRADLAALPQTTVSVRYGSGKGPQEHTLSGVPLVRLLPPEALATTDAKNDLLSFGVLAVGADGYRALVSYGEVSPDFGNRGLLVALTEDGKPLDQPRLAVPGDVKGGRYVSDLVELRVARIGD
ncbi:hypothetical protein [Pseudonocardia sp. EC080625-04]|uniref:hypothetical protein n=1 Tax=Pseudonocardia sp. EC080625-04 TaxID=1096868 RepID=UPI000761581B|nr:hypothetical protein [Pseudonocardia sp. EC080625-04]